MAVTSRSGTNAYMDIVTNITRLQSVKTLMLNNFVKRRNIKMQRKSNVNDVRINPLYEGDCDDSPSDFQGKSH